MAHGACGCVLGLSLAVYFASVGVSLQEIFGPKFYVYFVKGWTSKGRGSRYRSVYREYIGITEKHPDERKQEHMVRASKKGAKWLDFVEIEGSPVVLYETDSEESHRNGHGGGMNAGGGGLGQEQGQGEARVPNSTP